MRSYFRQQRKDGNVRRNNGVDEYVLSTEAKMSAYYFRFCHLIAIMNNPIVPLITTKVAEQAWELYRWYADSSIAILGSIYEENESGLRLIFGYWWIAYHRNSRQKKRKKPAYD
jgi:hypothetical protein